MEPPRRVGIALIAVAALLFAHGYLLDVLLTVEQPGPGISRRPLYVAAATVGAVSALGCSVRLLRSGTPPSIRDGVVLTALAAAGGPLVATLVDPGFHAVLSGDPIGAVRGLGTTLATTPAGVLGGAPAPTLAALLAPTVLLGIAAGRRAWQLVGASVALSVGIGLIVAGTSGSPYAPLAYVLVLAEPVVVAGSVSVPGIGWMLALVPAIVGFVSADAIRASTNRVDSPAGGSE